MAENKTLKTRQEIYFVKEDDGIEQIPTPSELGMPLELSNFGMISKFIVAETLLSEDGQKIRQQLIGIYTFVVKNRNIPDHINVLRWLENILRTQFGATQLEEFAGGKIDNLTNLLTKIKKLLNEGKSLDEINLEVSRSELYYDSMSIEAALGRDRPETEVERKRIRKEVISALASLISEE